MTPPNTSAAPDYQNAVVSAQSLLNTVAAGVTSVVVNVPLNAESLLIISNYTDDPPPLINVTGTGPVLEWPVYPLPPNFSQQLVAYMCPVSAALTPQVQVTWEYAPLQPWYVVSDASGRLTIDATIAGALGIIGNSVPYIGIVTVGSDGTYARTFSTDSNGRQIPLVPTLTTGLVTVNTTIGTLLTAPSSGGYYLFDADIRSSAAAAIAVTIETVASVAIASVNVPAGGYVSVPLRGYRVSAITDCIASATGALITLRYAPGP